MTELPFSVLVVVSLVHSVVVIDRPLDPPPPASAESEPELVWVVVTVLFKVTVSLSV